MWKANLSLYLEVPSIGQSSNSDKKQGYCDQEGIVSNIKDCSIDSLEQVLLYPNLKYSVAE